MLLYRAKLSPVQSELKMSEVSESGGQMSEKQLSLYVSLEVNMLMNEKTQLDSPHQDWHIVVFVWQPVTMYGCSTGYGRLVF